MTARPAEQGEPSRAGAPDVAAGSRGIEVR